MGNVWQPVAGVRRRTCFSRALADFSLWLEIGYFSGADPFRNGNLFQAALLSSYSSNASSTSSKALRSIRVNGLPHYYGPLRLPARTVPSVMHSLGPLRSIVLDHQNTRRGLLHGNPVLVKTMFRNCSSGAEYSTRNAPHLGM